MPCAATYYKELDYRYFPFGFLSTDIVAADRPQVTEWMKCNPHTLNLARLRLVRADGTEIQAEEIRNLNRTYDLCSGRLHGHRRQRSSQSTWLLLR